MNADGDVVACFAIPITLISSPFQCELVALSS